MEFEEWTPPASEYSPPSSDVDAIDEAKPVYSNPEAETQEVINDNLELMKEVVMRVRSDEEFARNIYRDCPRLQELLRKHPDIRPLFEDPKFIVINFEKVFRDAGGVLPGDPPKKPTRLERIKKVIGTITSHPLFRVFKWLLLIKKILFMFSPTKVFGLVQSCFCPGVEDMDVDVDGPSAEAIKAKEAINSAADRLEDPEIQQQMQVACEDPDKMEELIENNKELRELRDTNPLCAEMMNDPETFRMISDPDNLRALGEAPELIAMDFADPDWVPEDPGVNMDAPELEGEYEAEGEYEEEVLEEEEEEYDEEEDEEGNMLEDVEYEREDDDNGRNDNEIAREDGDDDDNDGDDNNRQCARGQNNRKNRDGEQEEEGEGEGRGKGFMAAFVGAGLGVMGGAIFDEMDALFGGDEVDMGGAGDVAGEDGFGDVEGNDEEENEDSFLMDKIEELEYEEEEEEEEKREEQKEEEAGTTMNNSFLDTVEAVEFDQAERAKEDDNDKGNNVRGRNMATNFAADGFEEWDGPQEDKEQERDRKKQERDRASRSGASRSHADGSRRRSRKRGTRSRDKRSSDSWVQY